MEVSVRTDNGSLGNVRVSDENLEIVRFEFNPSMMKSVNYAKILSAALMTVVDKMGNDARANAIAKTHVETACMYAVKSMTAESK